MSRTLDDDTRVLREVLDRHKPLSLPDVRSHEQRVDAAVLVPLLWAHVPAVTMLVRSADLRHHAGEVSFPGGKREPSDADLEATALREAHEEIGLLAHEVEVVGRLSPVPVATSRFRINPYVGVVHGRREPWRISGEACRAVDLSLQALTDGTIPYRAVRMEWAGHSILSPYFVLDGETTLYGASAFVLVEMLSVVGPVLGFTLPAPDVTQPG
jgi:8-oxo-dGTP pyrophosphatase MutT (NUDIX family)